MSRIFKKPVSAEIMWDMAKFKGWWKIEYCDTLREYAENIVEVVEVLDSVSNGYILVGKIGEDSVEILGCYITNVELLAIAEADVHTNYGDLGYLKVVKHKYGRSI